MVFEVNASMAVKWVKAFRKESQSASNLHGASASYPGARRRIASAGERE